MIPYEKLSFAYLVFVIIALGLSLSLKFDASRKPWEKLHLCMIGKNRLKIEVDQSVLRWLDAHKGYTTTTSIRVYAPSGESLWVGGAGWVRAVVEKRGGALVVKSLLDYRDYVVGKQDRPMWAIGLK